jgi:hypothetical protein
MDSDARNGPGSRQRLFGRRPGGLHSAAGVAAELQGDTAVILTVHPVRLLCPLIAGRDWLGLLEMAGKTGKIGRSIIIVHAIGQLRKNVRALAKESLGLARRPPIG